MIFITFAFQELISKYAKQAAKINFYDSSKLIKLYSNKCKEKCRTIQDLHKHIQKEHASIKL